MLRAVVDRLPASSQRRLKSALWFFRPLLGVLGFRARLSFTKGKDPFDYVSSSFNRSIQFDLWRQPSELLQIRRVRQAVAKARAEYLFSHNQIKQVAQNADKTAHNTLIYNLEGAMSAPDLDRPMIMMNVVTAIERVRRNIKQLDVLSIGPRSEIEIFGLKAAGFDLDRVRAIDLFSYSPYVEVGDMHALRFPDKSFDVVFLGWVLSYSRDQVTVIREILRVCRDRAIVVIAADYSDESRERSTFKNETTHVKNCEQVLALFGEHIRRVYFQHDPELPDVAMVMTVLEVKKP